MRENNNFRLIRKYCAGMTVLPGSGRKRRKDNKRAGSGWEGSREREAVATSLALGQGERKTGILWRWN